MVKSRVFLVAVFVLSLVACGGGGNIPSGRGPTPAPSTYPSTSSQTATLGSSPTNFTLGPIATGISAQVGMPGISGSASATLTLMDLPPTNVPAPSARRVHKMLRRDSLGATVTAIAYIEAAVTQNVSISQSPQLSMTVPAGTLSGYAYAVVYDPSNPAAGWNVVAGPAGPYSASSTSLSFASAPISPPIALVAKTNYVFAVVQTGSPLPPPTTRPTVSPTASPTASPAPSTTPAVVEGPGTHLSGTAEYRSQAWTPYGIASALDFPVQHGWDGTGQSVAVVIDSDVNRSYVQAYLSAMGISATPTITTVAVDGATGIPSQDASKNDQDEAYLDVETLAGLAPGAHIYIYDIPGLDDQSIADAYSKLNSDGFVKVANSSFGGCEMANSPEDLFIAQGTAAGIAYVASAGDDGNTCDGTKPGPNWPASNPNVVAVGGTETLIGGGFPVTSNTVWNDDSCGSGSPCAGGGGVSQLYSLPSYQNALAGEASTTNRNEPDIALPAEDDVLNDGQLGLIDGTSWASPQYAALMAEVLQYCNLSSGLANAVNLPYFVESHYQQAYIDVINGNNFFAGTPYYSAGAGYDNASGFGVPYGMAYANTACPGRREASGLLRRTMMAARTEVRPVNAPLDVTPRVAGIIDRGRRSGVAMTRVEIVLNAESNRSAVETVLEQAGFTIDARYQYQRIVHAQAPAATVEQFFSTELHDVLQPHFGTRYMPVREVALPRSIAPYVRTVNLDDVITRRVRSHIAPGWPLDALN